MLAIFKNLLAAIVGYIAMAVALFALFSLLWLTLGPSVAFQPGSWEISGGWAVGSVVLGLVAAYVGGRVCARVAHESQAVWILIVIVIALGIVTILMPVEMASGPRPDDVSMMEATANAGQPTWMTWLNPVIGVVGVWIGSRRLRRREALM